jgi:hypothetical protein
VPSMEAATKMLVRVLWERSVGKSSASGLGPIQ